ncbi:MAG: hypothetical protein R3259_01605 [Salinimicrobium sediminis]|nr:hypothetical protein [Salinimicrobium sediminis]
MAEDQITKGDVVCLKSDKNKCVFPKFTVGGQHSGSEYEVYWYAENQLKDGNS